MVKDLEATSFGLLIAFILPGFAALGVLALWSSALAQLFSGFLTAESTIGLSVLLILMSIVVSLYISILRSLLFENLICRKSKLNSEDFSALENEGTLAAFRAATDEMYRYHQFWGGMSIVIPFGYLSWLQRHGGLVVNLPSLIPAITVEALGVYAAIVSYRKHIERANRILGGGNDAKRMAEGNSRKKSTPAPLATSGPGGATPEAQPPSPGAAGT